MMNSLIPFLKDGIIGYTGIKVGEIPWSKKGRAVYNGETNLTELLAGTNLKFQINSKKIYVLINQRTSSAGEAALISLKSLHNVKILGKKTMGAATTNATIKLKNEDILNLTAGYMMDVKKNIYPIGISPDYELCIED